MVQDKNWQYMMLNSDKSQYFYMLLKCGSMKESELFKYY